MIKQPHNIPNQEVRMSKREKFLRRTVPMAMAGVALTLLGITHKNPEKPSNSDSVSYSIPAKSSEVNAKKETLQVLNGTLIIKDGVVFHDKPDFAYIQTDDGPTSSNQSNINIPKGDSLEVKDPFLVKNEAYDETTQSNAQTLWLGFYYERNQYWIDASEIVQESEGSNQYISWSSGNYNLSFPLSDTASTAINKNDNYYVGTQEVAVAKIVSNS